MPDPEGNIKTDEEAIPATPLHAYTDGREEDIKGDGAKLSSDDPKHMQQDDLEGDDEPQLPKH